MRRRRILKALSMLAALCATATALIGVMHTPAGLAAYARVFGGGCPVGRADPAEVERGRRASARALRGTLRAPARPAFGFALDVSTRRDLDRWIAQHGLSCRDRREHTLVLDEVTFAFAPGAMSLVNLTAVRYRLAPGAAVRHAGAVIDGLRVALGTPSETVGVMEPASLSATDYATAMVSYAFRDFIADVTATNIPGEGVLVREHYMSAVD
jgi:hypothetical protein